MKNLQRILHLFGQIRRPPREVLEGATDNAISAFEARTKTRLPPDVAVWLRVCNGSRAGPGGLFGIDQSDPEILDIEGLWALIPNWRKRRWLPIAGDGCGNYYIVPLDEDFGDEHPVIFVDMISNPDAPEYIVASDIEHFLNFLFERELGDSSWPFAREAVLARDPAIRKFSGVALPWDAE
jgi:cell wall assembly regulator SMI1